MPVDAASRNLELLRRNPYPGRGLVVGRTPAGRLAQVYWLTGRSEDSRNRVLVRDGDGVRTAPLDPERLRDPSLIIYRAMGVAGGRWHVVSNGDQTETLLSALEAGRSFEEALLARTFEPDAPHFTPRIAGLVEAGPGAGDGCALAILKAPGNDPGLHARQFFRYAPLRPGRGHGLTTYAGEGDPLPPFAGEPLELPLPGDAADIGATYWEALPPARRVALAVKLIDPVTGVAEVHIVNRGGTG
jgi:IMP cyclohydrolase